MGHKFHDILFTPSVKSIQEQNGSRRSYARFEGTEEQRNVIGPAEAQFIAARDSFYIASVGEGGWPYIQHRGGPVGFLRVLSNKAIGFADFAGNRQYITLGNLQGESRVSLFLMDYPNRARLKILGHAQVSTDPEILGQLTVPDYNAKIERGFTITIAGLDWNCSQHITPRFSGPELLAMREERLAAFTESA